MDPITTTQMSGPITTATSAAEGRLKVDAGGIPKRKKVLKKLLNKMKMKNK